MTDESIRTISRTVRAFVSLDEAERDRVERDEIILLDMHGLWWSVPMELDIHQVNGQVLAYLAGAELGRFPNLIVRMARSDHPARDMHLAVAAGVEWCTDHEGIALTGMTHCDRSPAAQAAPCSLEALLYVRRPA